MDEFILVRAQPNFMSGSGGNYSSNGVIQIKLAICNWFSRLAEPAFHEPSLNATELKSILPFCVSHSLVKFGWNKFGDWISWRDIRDLSRPEFELSSAH